MAMFNWFKVTAMLSDGLQMGGLCLVVEFQRGGSTTNGAILSSSINISQFPRNMSGMHSVRAVQHGVGSQEAGTRSSNWDSLLQLRGRVNKVPAGHLGFSPHHALAETAAWFEVHTGLNHATPAAACCLGWTRPCSVSYTVVTILCSVSYTVGGDLLRSIPHLTLWHSKCLLLFNFCFKYIF